MTRVTMKVEAFFDRANITSAMDAATRRSLSRAGAFIRTTAKRSMAKRKKGSSAPGSPPFAHIASKQGLRNILFFYDKATQTVIVGPVKFRTKVNVPHLMEHGGNVRRVRRSRRGKPRGHQTLKYPPRPFMKPALEKEAPELPGLYQEAFRREMRRRKERVRKRII